MKWGTQMMRFEEQIEKFNLLFFLNKFFQKMDCEKKKFKTKKNQIWLFFQNHTRKFKSFPYCADFLYQLGITNSFLLHPHLIVLPLELAPFNQENLQFLHKLPKNCPVSDCFALGKPHPTRLLPISNLPCITI